jgi:Domain of unknown function (DUF4367)
MKSRPNGRRVGLWVCTMLGILLVLSLYATRSSGSNSSTVNGNFSGSSPPNFPEASSLYLWDLGTPTTLQQANQSLPFHVKTPSYLPASTTLSNVRILTGGNEVILGYSTEGVQPMLNNTLGWTLAIAVYQTSSNPIAPASAPLRSISEVTSYPNGTEITHTESATTTTSIQDRQTTTINGTAAVVIDVSNQPTSISWWSNGLFYQVVGNMPVGQLVEVAQSMGS